MNTFIPTLIAVLLAETGGRASQFARLPRLSLAATLLGLSVGAAAFAGSSLAPTINGDARALMLGIALILTGCGQFAKAPAGDPPLSVGATLLFVWRSGAPFLAFAFAAWKSAPVGAAAGALAGVMAAAVLGAVPLGPAQMTWLRRSAGLTMTLIGIYALIWALRLLR